MKARIGIDDLRLALGTVKPSLRSDKPYVVLDTAADEGLMVATDNWDIQIRTQVREAWSPAKDRGAVAVPHRPLTELASRLPGGTEVEMSSEETVLEVRAGGTDMRLPLADFELPHRHEPDGDEIDVDVVDWEAVWRVAGHASTDPSRPTLHGLVIEPDAVASTDSFRLATYKLATGMTSHVPAGMIPKVTDEELDQVTLVADERGVKITVGDTTSWGAPIAAKPPAWRALLEGSTFAHNIVVDTEALTELIGRVGIAGRAAPAGGHVLVLDPLEAGMMMVSSDSLPDDPNGRVEEAIAIDGELPYRTGVSDRFLADALKVMGTDKTSFDFPSSPTQPMGLGHAGFTLLLMPIKVS